jgi:hypothetical protein
MERSGIAVRWSALLGDWWKYVLKQYAKQLATFWPTPILSEFGHERVCCGKHYSLAFHTPPRHIFGKFVWRP